MVLSVFTDQFVASIGLLALTSCKTIYFAYRSAIIVTLKCICSSEPHPILSKSSTQLSETVKV